MIDVRSLSDSKNKRMKKTSKTVGTYHSDQNVPMLHRAQHNHYNKLTMVVGNTTNYLDHKTTASHNHRCERGIDTIHSNGVKVINRMAEVRSR